MNGIYLIIGGNMGNTMEYFSTCYALLEKHLGVIVTQSKIYETKPWGTIEQNNFLNQVLYISTDKNINSCMHTILQIEKDMGRTRSIKWDARIIDIDILYFNNDIVHTAFITVPHKHLHERKFVLVPLCDIAPNFLHPILKKTTQELLQQCTDTLDVHLLQ